MARGSAGESVLHKHLRVLESFDPRASLPRRSARSRRPRASRPPPRTGWSPSWSGRDCSSGCRTGPTGSGCGSGSSPRARPARSGLRELARPWLGAVHARVRQHTQLGVLAGLDVLFIERMSTRDAVVNATLIGGPHPAADLLQRARAAGPRRRGASSTTWWMPGGRCRREHTIRGGDDAAGAAAARARRRLRGRPTGTSTPSRGASPCRCSVRTASSTPRWASSSPTTTRLRRRRSSCSRSPRPASPGRSRRPTCPGGERPGIPLMTTSVRSLEYFASSARR